MIKIAIVDDHQITRHGIKTIVELNSDIKVILESSNGKDFLEKLSSINILPDIIMLDINMPVMNGYTTIEKIKIKYPAINIIVFSLLEDQDSAFNMINHGASAFINKGIDPSLLGSVIKEVYQNGYYLNEYVKKEYLNNKTINKKKDGFRGKEFLNEKELAFMRLSTTNMTLKEIAVCMGVQPKTIENYRDSLFQKLEVKNRAALIMYGFKNGLIDFFDKK